MNTTTLSFPSLEVRAGQSPRGRYLSGIAAPFGSDAAVDGLTETIAVGAFTRALSGGGDILALVDHQADKLLARTGNKSLSLRETEHGLEYDLTLPDTQLGRDVHAMAADGLLGGVSIGFASAQAHRDGPRRKLLDIDLREISVVQAFAAYADTSVEARQMSDPEKWFLATNGEPVPMDDIAEWRAWVSSKE